MSYDQQDHVQARIMEAGFALEPIEGFLELAPNDLIPGNRDQAEAFIVNAPSLYGYDRDTERIFMALDIAVSAVQADPTYGGGYALAAACMYRMGVQDVDIFDSRALTVAIPWAHRATVVDPDFEMGWEVYVECHCFKGHFETTEKALGEIYKRFGDNDLYARTAFLFFRLKGEVGQALNWGALAWQTEWDSVRLVHTLFALGHLYRDVDDWQRALDTYRVVTERDHENAWAFHYISMCAAELGNFALALEQSERAVKLGQLHEFREFHEQLKKRQKRARMGGGRGIAPAPSTKRSVTGLRRRKEEFNSKVVAAPPPKHQEVIPAPPAANPPKVVAAPPPSQRSKPVPAPPPAKKVVAPPPAKKVAAPPPAKKPQTRPGIRKRRPPGK